MNFSSLLTATNCQPSSSRRRASSIEKTCRPLAIFCRAAASRIRVERRLHAAPSKAASRPALGATPPGRSGRRTRRRPPARRRSRRRTSTAAMCSVWITTRISSSARAIIVLGGRPVVQGVQAAADRAVPLGRILGRLDDRAGLGGVHDHRRDDPHRPAVEDRLDQVVPAGLDPGQGDAAGVGDGAEHQGGGVDVGVGVLHVHGQPGQARPRQEPTGHDAPQRQPGADLGLPLSQGFLDGIGLHENLQRSGDRRCRLAIRRVIFTRV